MKKDKIQSEIFKKMLKKQKIDAMPVYRQSNEMVVTNQTAVFLDNVRGYLLNNMEMYFNPNLLNICEDYGEQLFDCDQLFYCNYQDKKLIKTNKLVVSIAGLCRLFVFDEHHFDGLYLPEYQLGYFDDTADYYGCSESSRVLVSENGQAVGVIMPVVNLMGWDKPIDNIPRTEQYKDQIFGVESGEV